MDVIEYLKDQINKNHIKNKNVDINFTFTQNQVNPIVFYKINKDIKKKDREIMKNYNPVDINININNNTNTNNTINNNTNTNNTINNTSNNMNQNNAKNEQRNDINPNQIKNKPKITNITNTTIAQSDKKEDNQNNT